MQAVPPGGPPRRERPNFAALARAMRYLARYRRLAGLAYLSLLVSSAAQLAVPQVVQSIVDTVVRAAANPPGAAATGDAQRALLLSGALIVLFALARGLFAFSQSFNSERVSQSIA